MKTTSGDVVTAAFTAANNSHGAHRKHANNNGDLSK